MDHSRRKIDTSSVFGAGRTPLSTPAGSKPVSINPLQKPELHKPPVPRRSLPEANSQVPDMIRRVYSLLEGLQQMIPRSFFPEGGLDESLGEARAAALYDLILLEREAKVSVAETAQGRQVQLKVTRSRKGTVGLYERPESLLVLQLSGRQIVELYNGPTKLPWETAGRTRKNAQRRIPVSRLRTAGLSIPDADRVCQQEAGQ